MLQAINSMHSPWADVMMFNLSSRWIWVGFYAVILWYLWQRFGTRRTILVTLGVALTIMLADQLCASLIRPLVARMRPSHIDNPLSESLHLVNGYRGGAFGFPSCHAANTFGVALLLALVIRNRMAICALYLWVALNCYSRMYLGVHYPGDITAGAVVGSVCAWAVYGMITLANKRITYFKASPAIDASPITGRGATGTQTGALPPEILFAALLLTIVASMCLTNQ